MAVATTKEKQHMALVASLGCIVCKNLGYTNHKVELHHIRDGYGVGQRATNFEVIPLCPIHHRIGLKADKTGKAHFGYHQSPKDFEIAYGKERDLLEQVMEMVRTVKSQRLAMKHQHYSYSADKSFDLRKIHDNHLKNILRGIEKQAKRGIENDKGDMVYGDDVKVFRNYEVYVVEARRRGIMHLI